MSFSILPAFIDHPRRIRFTKQEENEEIDLFLRQHWAVNLGWITTALVTFFVPALIIYIDSFVHFLDGVPATTILGFLILWYMLLSAYVLEKFLFWYFNVYIITNQNLVDINFYSLLSRSIVEVRLKDIQSQSASIKGLRASFFHYGDVHIVSASEKQIIDFTAVPKPDEVADRIQDLRTRLRG